MPSAPKRSLMEMMRSVAGPFGPEAGPARNRFAPTLVPKSAATRLRGVIGAGTPDTGPAMMRFAPIFAHAAMRVPFAVRGEFVTVSGEGSESPMLDIPEPVVSRE